MMHDSRSPSNEILLDRELLLTLGSSSSLEQKVAQIFELLRDPVYRYMFRALRDRQAAEDLTQEVFLRLFTCLHQGQAVRDIRAWVFRVAHNLVIDRQKRKLVLGQMDEALWDQTQDPDPGAEQRLLEKDQDQRLHRALARLTPQEKECLELRAEGLSYQEIAGILEMRVPTLVKFVGRIIRKLAEEVNRV
jgi:RNA polymerase sigma-70 factor (ECF subfamily)